MSRTRNASLVGLIIMVMIGVVIWEEQSAVSARGSNNVYLPLTTSNHDGSLKTPIFGLQMYGVTDEATVYYPYLIESTAQWVRVAVSWKITEPSHETPAVYKWDSIDRRLAVARRDLGHLNMVATIHDAPEWAGPDPDGPLPPGSMDEFADFVGALVERFDGDGIDDAPNSPVILYWEFYNEPDNNSDVLGNPNYSPPTHWGDHGARYAQMLAAVYPKVKAANARAKVVLGGLAYDGFEDTGGPFVRDFLNDVLAAGGGNYFDVTNFHSYPAFFATWTNNKGPGLLEKANHIRGVLQNHGYSKPMIVTETGWFSNERPEQTIPGSPEVQSRYVVQLFTQSMAADLDMVIWWLLRDSDFPYPFMNGLVTNDTVPLKKMSFYTFQRAVAELSTAHFVRRLPLTETGNSLIEAYRFEDKVHNRQLYVAWLNPVYTTQQALLRLPAAQAVVRNSVTGAALFVRDADDGVVDGRITVQVWATPLYVEVSQ